jgi:RNA polymerase sigma-70 factor (ECF subfamily)
MTLTMWRPKARGPASDAWSFGELALPLLPALYNFATWMTRDRTAAEDLVQEALFKGLRGFSAFEPGTNFKAWIFRILRNTFLTSRSGLAHMRTVALEDEIDEESGSGYPESIVDRRTPELDLLRLRDAEALEAAMNKLSAPLLEVLLLCDVEGMKYREVAVLLGIPIGTVMSRLARARAFLRNELSEVTDYTREAKR